MLVNRRDCYCWGKPSHRWAPTRPWKLMNGRFVERWSVRLPSTLVASAMCCDRIRFTARGTQYDWFSELDWDHMVSLGTSGTVVAAARALSVSQMLAFLYSALGRNDANGALCRRRPGPTPGLSMTSAVKTSVLRAGSADPNRRHLVAGLQVLTAIGLL